MGHSPCKYVEDVWLIMKRKIHAGLSSCLKKIAISHELVTLLHNCRVILILQSPKTLRRAPISPRQLLVSPPWALMSLHRALLLPYRVPISLHPSASVCVFQGALRVLHDFLIVFHDVSQSFTSVLWCFMSVSWCLTMFSESRNNWYLHLHSPMATLTTARPPIAAGISNNATEIGDNDAVAGKQATISIY